MNRLTSTLIYQQYSKAQNLTEVYKMGFNPFVVPKSFYLAKLEELKRYKYPLSEYTRKSISDNSVIPIMFEDPIDPNNKEIKFTPQLFPLCHFPVATKVEKGVPLDMVMYVNTFRGAYKRNKQTKEPEYYDIQIHDFYGMMQTGAVARGLKLKEKKINAAVSFHKLIGNIYGELFAKAVDGNRKWSVSGGQPQRMALLRFLAVIFYFENMVEKTKPEAIELALTCFNVNEKQYLMDRCNYVHNDNFNIYNAPLNKRIPKITEFCDILKDQFPEISDLTYPNLTLVYREMYGDYTLFCIEDFGSFIGMLQFVNLSYGLFKDKVISKQFVVEKYMNDVMKQLAALLEG